MANYVLQYYFIYIVVLDKPNTGISEPYCITWYTHSSEYMLKSKRTAFYIVTQYFH